MGTIYYETAPMPQTDGTNIVVNGDGKLDLGTDITTKLSKVDDKEDSSNKVTTLSSSSTDTQYPSAKCVYDLVGDVESLLANL